MSPSFTLKSRIIFISQDGENSAVSQTIESTAKKFHDNELFHLRYINTNTRKPSHDVYYRISAHYKWMLSKMFDDLNYPSIIILEGGSFSVVIFDFCISKGVIWEVSIECTR